MVIGLEERLAKQQALATHWKREAFKWAQEAESDSIADAHPLKAEDPASDGDHRRSTC